MTFYDRSRPPSEARAGPLDDDVAKKINQPIERARGRSTNQSHARADVDRPGVVFARARRCPRARVVLALFVDALRHTTFENVVDDRRRSSSTTESVVARASAAVTTPKRRGISRAFVEKTWRARDRWRCSPS